MVVLAKGRERISVPVEFVYSGEGEDEILVADLAEGVWIVDRDGQRAGDVTVSREGGVACFRGAAGGYRLHRRDEASGKGS